MGWQAADAARVKDVQDAADALLLEAQTKYSVAKTAYEKQKTPGTQGDLQRAGRDLQDAQANARNPNISPKRSSPYSPECYNSSRVLFAFNACVCWVCAG